MLHDRYSLHTLPIEPKSMVFRDSFIFRFHWHWFNRSSSTILFSISQWDEGPNQHDYILCALWDGPHYWTNINRFIRNKEFLHHWDLLGAAEHSFYHDVIPRQKG